VIAVITIASAVLAVVEPYRHSGAVSWRTAIETMSVVVVICSVVRFAESRMDDDERAPRGPHDPGSACDAR
jgi:hypothetical protein